MKWLSRCETLAAIQMINSEYPLLVIPIIWEHFKHCLGKWISYCDAHVLSTFQKSYHTDVLFSIDFQHLSREQLAYTGELFIIFVGVNSHRIAFATRGILGIEPFSGCIDESKILILSFYMFSV